MRILLGTVVALGVLIAGCSGAAPAPPTPEAEAQTLPAATATIGRNGQEGTQAAYSPGGTIDAQNVAPTSGTPPAAPTFESVQGMTPEEISEWATRVSEAGSLWRALAMCEPRFVDPIPQGGTAEHAWQAALPFLSSQATRDCIITTVVEGGAR